jgi:hypothetical protein
MCVLLSLGMMLAYAPVAAQTASSVTGVARAVRAIRAFRVAVSKMKDEELPQSEREIGRSHLAWGSELGGSTPRSGQAYRARLEALNRALDSAAREAPYERWIVMLRARFRVADGEFNAAERLVVEGCLETEWRCVALLGYTRHLQRRFIDAERDFDRALSLMPSQTRCEWDDLSVLMTDSSQIRAYRKLGCDERRPLNERIWWLADPLYSQPGNDRRTEHYARLMAEELVRIEAVNVFDRPVGEYDQLRARSPFPTGAIKGGLASFCLELPSRQRCVYGIDVRTNPPARFARLFIPVRTVIATPFAVTISDDGLDARMQTGGTTYFSGTRGPRPRAADEPWIATGWMPEEEYAAYDGPVVRIPEAQVAYLLRGDSAVFLVAFDPRVDQTLSTGNLIASVVLTRAPSDVLRMTTVPHSTRGAVRLAMPATLDSTIVSLEAIRPTFAVARHRFAVLPKAGANGDRVKASDLVLFAGASGTLPRNASEALDLMLPTTTIARGASLGMYWELTGLRPGDTPNFSLRVAREEGGLWATISQVIPLRARVGPVKLTWSGETVLPSDIGADSQAAFALLTETTSLRPGRYQFVLTATVPGAAPVEITRVVDVRAGA